MGFTIEELIEEILKSPLEEEQKVELLGRIYKSGHLNKGLYLRKRDGEDTLECWYRNVDESGQTEHGNTHYTAEETVASYVVSTMKNTK